MKKLNWIANYPESFPSTHRRTLIPIANNVVKGLSAENEIWNFLKKNVTRTISQSDIK